MFSLNVIMFGRLGTGLERHMHESSLGGDVPVVWNFWVHPVHRRKGLGRQLLEAMAAHFGRQVREMGFWLPISREAVGVLLSMGITEVAGCY